MDNNFTLKKFYLAVILIAFALAVGVFVFYATETPIYAARGKLSYFFNVSSPQSNNIPYTSDTFTKSISDSIQTRAFLTSLYQEANIKLPTDKTSKPSEFVTSSVVSGSNVIQVNIYSTNKDNLGKLSMKFITALNKLPIITQTVPPPTISITEPLYTDPNPSFPKPLEYAGLVFIGSLLVGIMFLYIFSNNDN